MFKIVAIVIGGIIFVFEAFLLTCHADDDPPYPKDAPDKWEWHPWLEQLAFEHVVNLTELIVKDTTYKLRHADKIQEKHKHSITYELGTIAAGILDAFKEMLKLYAKFSHDKAMVDQWYTPNHVMHAFHRMQGLYHSIRLEKGMFYDIVREYESTRGMSSSVPGFSLPPGVTLPKQYQHYGK